ncbi:hypothetical protein GCM10010466_65470 [Planomonospora alba]|uniref:Uncharacterized protein n=1 Tax=Planomonospora alba TaxID=161354 RepID=A0ABP6P2W9_9ACTN
MSRRPDLPAGELAARLTAERDADAVRRADELARALADAEHDQARRDLGVRVRLAELDRAEREAQASASAELSRLYRKAVAAGERTRISAGLARSAEARALRLEQTRTLNLRVLIPVLVGFGAWSTTGVQEGAARLMAVDSGAPTWWALWILEPVLLGAVVWVIIARARLASAGGRLAEAAERIAAACLTTSVLLNVVAALPGEGGPTGWEAVGAIVAHIIGPLGAAATAHLIGVVDASISSADPWHERGVRVPTLAEMDLRPPATPALGTASEPAAETAVDSAAESTQDSAPERPTTVWPVLPEGRALLPIVARPAAPESAPRTGTSQDGQGKTRAARRVRPATRPNKGVPLPPVLKAASARTLTDADLAERLAALVVSGELAANASIRQVSAALGIGFERAKRVLSTSSAGAVEIGQERGEVAA